MTEGSQSGGATQAPMINFSRPDLSQHPPRSARVRLGGFAQLPRLLDKARALAAGTIGPYDYPAMMDSQFFDFTGIDADAILSRVKSGASDAEMLQWVRENMNPKRQPHEIAQWSAWLETFGAHTAKGHEWLGARMKECGPGRDDVQSYCEHLDIDDYTSYGGKM